LQLFRNYCTPEWQEVTRANLTRLIYAPGEPIFKEGQPCQNMYLVARGRVKVFARYGPDTEVILRLVGDHEVLGHRGLGDDMIYPVTAEALTETRLNFLPIQVFNDLLKANPEFCFHFLYFMAEELKRSETQRKDQLNMTVRQRVAWGLQKNMNAFGFDTQDKKLLTYSLSRKDLTAVANTTYESVVRTLASFEQEGIIELVNKQIRILNKRLLGKAIRG
jgi:CRP/FNR family cyclic AMP-dependent transcriptional regulator